MYIFYTNDPHSLFIFWSIILLYIEGNNILPMDTSVASPWTENRFQDWQEEIAFGNKALRYIYILCTLL